MDEINRAAAALSLWELQIIASCAALSAMAGLCRGVDDNAYRSIWHLFSLGATSGLLGAATASLVGYVFGGIAGNELLVLFMAIATGFAGRSVEVRMRELSVILLDLALAKTAGMISAMRPSRGRDFQFPDQDTQEEQRERDRADRPPGSA